MEYKDYEATEKDMGETMAKYQQSVLEITGLDPRGGQIGPIEIYKVARKAIEDYMAEKKKTDIII